jgi:hypothetical protein
LPSASFLSVKLVALLPAGFGCQRPRKVSDFRWESSVGLTGLGRQQLCEHLKFFLGGWNLLAMSRTWRRWWWPASATVAKWRGLEPIGGPQGQSGAAMAVMGLVLPSLAAFLAAHAALHKCRQLA